jgi:acylphosphatase
MPVKVFSPVPTAHLEVQIIVFTEKRAWYTSGTAGEKNMGMKRLHLFVSGRVQGVFYRASTRDKAVGLGLTGWVKNLDDGRVECLFEGDESALTHILEWCRTGPPGSAPEGLEATWSERRGEFRDFRITYR